MASRLAVLLGLVAAADALLMTPVVRAPVRPAQASAVRMLADPSIIADHSSIDAASQLLALSIPIPEYSPAKVPPCMPAAPRPLLGVAADASTHRVAGFRHDGLQHCCHLHHVHAPARSSAHPCAHARRRCPAQLQRTMRLTPRASEFACMPDRRSPRLPPPPQEHPGQVAGQRDPARRDGRVLWHHLVRAPRAPPRSPQCAHACAPCLLSTAQAARGHFAWPHRRGGRHPGHAGLGRLLGGRCHAAELHPKRELDWRGRESGRHSSTHPYIAACLASTNTV